VKVINVFVELASICTKHDRINEWLYMTYSIKLSAAQFKRIRAFFSASI